jgi:hypothetical protein
LKISARKEIEVGRPPPPLGRPPGHLLLYKSPFSHCFYAPSTFMIFSVQFVSSFLQEHRREGREWKKRREKRGE